MAYPFIPLPPSKKGSFPPPPHFVQISTFFVGRGGGGGGFMWRCLVFILSQGWGFNTFDLHYSYFNLKLIQFCYSYCYKYCLVHITSCWNSFLVQILSGRLHQHQPQPSTAPPLSCIYPVQWGMFCFQRSSCHICVLPCAEYWCKPDTWC